MDLQLVSSHPTADLNQEALDEFIEHRQELKKPMTPLAIKKASNLLLKFSLPQQAYMVDTAILSGWRGLYPVDPPKQTSSKQTSIESDLTDRSWA